MKDQAVELALPGAVGSNTLELPVAGVHTAG